MDKMGGAAFLVGAILVALGLTVWAEGGVLIAGIIIGAAGYVLIQLGKKKS